MSAPTRAQIGYFRGSNVAPTNNTDPIGGAIYTSAELDPGTPSNLWSTLTIGSSDVSYYSVHYRKALHSAPGSLQNARIYNRAGCQLNTGSGTASIVSTASDENCTVRLIGKISGSWDTEELDAVGTTVDIGSKTWDTGTVYVWEVTSGTPKGNISCFINGELVGVIYGTNDDPVDGNSESIACYMVSALDEWAVATALNTDLSAANRLTAPTGIGSFSRPTYWAGEDQSTNIPTGVMEANDYIGVVGKRTVPANMVQPLRSIQAMIVVLGDAQNT